MKTAVVGGLTIDLFGDEQVVGGPAWYAGTAAASTGLAVSVFSAVGEDYPERFIATMKQLGIDVSSVIRIAGASSSVFRHQYTATGRKSRLLSQGPTIPVKLLESLDTDIALLSPVFKEADEQHLKLIKNRAGMTALDLQGLIRDADESGNIRLVHRDVSRFLQLADVVHCSDEEALVLAGVKDLVEAVANIGRQVGGIFMVGSRKGLFLVEKNFLTFFEEASSRDVVDATGAGDMLTAFFISFVSRGYSAEDAAASALGLLRHALENPPPYRVTQCPPAPVIPARVAWSRSV
ncbi:MAG: PfkB family carbohydrate kinase [Candidatus Caldarchaeum sp.]|nr:PfkB family carbohydrate kinase [Candidatus Caldarchaeum sp.]